MKIIKKLVPDTSIIIENLVSKKISEKEFKVEEIIIHEAVLSELEHQANVGKEIGHLGLEEIKKLQELSKKNKFKISFSGRRPVASEIRHASLGEVDALIRDLASELNATLITGDKVQSKVAEAKGMDVICIEDKRDEKGLLQLSERLNIPLKFIHKVLIKTVEEGFSKSELVKNTLGVYSVAEPCAILGGFRCQLLLPKTKMKGTTIAIAEERFL